MKIYTKTGDDGTTALFDGTRVLKSDMRVVAYGETDELNATIGVALSFIKNTDLRDRLLRIQKELFALGAKLANPQERKQKDKADFTEEFVVRLENEIDLMEKSLPAMTNFILPGGCPAAATLHLARTVCRRSERHMLSLFSQKQLDLSGLDGLLLRYVNRLSDYLFVCARFANHLESVADIPW